MQRLEKLNELHAKNPDDPDIHYMIAQEHAQQGDHAASLGWYDTCLENDPDYHYAYFHKAKSQEATGDTDGARRTLDAGLARAREANNQKAVNEIEGFLAQLP
jgi:tetratricopeptide (TPR) repeat protein